MLLKPCRIPLASHVQRAFLLLGNEQDTHLLIQQILCLASTLLWHIFYCINPSAASDSKHHPSFLSTGICLISIQPSLFLLLSPTKLLKPFYSKPKQEPINKCIFYIPALRCILTGECAVPLYSPECLHPCIMTVFSIPSAARQNQTNSCADFKAGKILIAASACLQWMERHPPWPCCAPRGSRRQHPAFTGQVGPVTLRPGLSSHPESITAWLWVLLAIRLALQCHCTNSSSPSKAMKHPSSRNKLDGRISSPEEEDLGVLGDEKLPKTWQCALAFPFAFRLQKRCTDWNLGNLPCFPILLLQQYFSLWGHLHSTNIQITSHMLLLSTKWHFHPPKHKHARYTMASVPTGMSALRKLTIQQPTKLGTVWVTTGHPTAVRHGRKLLKKEVQCDKA